MVPGCKFINDNDGSLQYSDGWKFSSSDPNGLVHSVHFSRTPGCSVSLVKFNASNVIVFGLIPSGSSPPQASYSIDGGDPNSSHMAATSQCVPNQQLFNSGNLGAGLHNLTIKVTTASQDQPYILDYLWMCGDSGAINGTVKGASDKAATSTKTTSTTSTNTILIIAVAVLGILVLSLAVAVYVLLSRIRRKRQGQEFQVDPEKQKSRSLSPDLDSSEDAVTPPQHSAATQRSKPPKMRPEVPVNDVFLEEGAGLSEISNNSTENLGSTVDGDRPSSSLGPAPSTTSTVLARRVAKMVRFRSPITSMRSLYPPEDRHHRTGSMESRNSDGQPPSYTSE